MPTAVSVAGGVLLAAFGAALIAVRPADKAALNEGDQRRYSRLRSEAATMDNDALRRALDKARESDAQEVEPLRDLAYNDVMRETGNEAHQLPLRPAQRLLAVIA